MVDKMTERVEASDCIHVESAVPSIAAPRKLAKQPFLLLTTSRTHAARHGSAGKGRLVRQIERPPRMRRWVHDCDSEPMLQQARFSVQEK